jgi:hypothetical protein
LAGDFLVGVLPPEEAEPVVRWVVAALEVVLALAVEAFDVVFAVVRLAADRLALGPAEPALAPDRFAGAFGWGPVGATGGGFGSPLHVGT